MAFSNARGGVILVGVDDAGRPRGRAAGGGAADAIHTALSEAHDLGRYDLHALDVEGVAITVVSVARREQGFAQTSNGRVLVRKGSQDRALFGPSCSGRSTSARAPATSRRSPLSLDAASPVLLARLAEAHGWRSGSPSPDQLERIGSPGTAG